MTRLSLFLTAFAAVLLTQPTAAQDTTPFGQTVTWDHHSLLFDGHRVCPVMGEIHYSRIPADEWSAEVGKMREGGVTIVATYVFWNHIEEEEGIFRWDGQRSLRRFLEVCKAEGLPVVLRMGPWCHGEVRNGGLPDWLFTKGCKMRSQDSTFLAYTTRLYRQIFTQVQGLQWKDGGPVIAAQFDNEYRGPAEYLLALKRIALAVGFDLPFYTRTGWPELTTPMPFGEMLPLYGDYADGFWDKSTKEGVGSYYKAFNFKGQVKPASNMGAPDSGSPTTLPDKEKVGTSVSSDPSSSQVHSAPSLTGRAGGESTYPYFTCELGGGMATAYHRRPYVYPEDAYAMALVKLGSGSNLLGYYMYHGGTNPEGKLTSLNECQTSPFTANNDLPVCTYDFQAPLGEFGQTYPQYYGLRPLHLFMQDFGELLAPMEATFPSAQDLKQGDDNALRWSYRHSNGQAFIFVNNYERFADLKPKTTSELEACGIRLPKLTIPAGCSAIFPVNVAGLRYATAQLVAQHDGKTYLMQVPGIPATLAFSDGKTLKSAKPRGTAKPIYKHYYLLTRDEAEHLFLTSSPSGTLASSVPTFTKVRDAGPLRTITKGRAKVAAAPEEADWQQAAVYRITLPSDSSLESHSSFVTRHSSLLRITYRGDCARLYANGHLIADNFYYGRPFLYGLWRLPAGCIELELRILPLQPEAPIYLPREADHAAGEAVVTVELTPNK
ncbi:MAG: beta-galactosidase [Bacteroidaceae bacterium]|nr:beta-galactosidase [Bacteroidaceae bacterium]